MSFILQKFRRDRAVAFGCCWCSVGVFFPLIGFSLFFTGFCIVVSHHTFLTHNSSPRWDLNQAGLMFGYALLSTGLASTAVGVLVAVIYFTGNYRTYNKVGCVENGQMAGKVKEPVKPRKTKATVMKSVSPKRKKIPSKHKRHRHFHRRKTGWLEPHPESPKGKRLELRTSYTRWWRKYCHTDTCLNQSINHPSMPCASFVSNFGQCAFRGNTKGSYFIDMLKVGRYWLFLADILLMKVTTLLLLFNVLYSMPMC